MTPPHDHYHHQHRHQNPTCAGHGDDGPVQGLGQGVEHRAGLVLLQGVGQAREDQHPHAHRHAQQQQLPGVNDRYYFSVSMLPNK